MHFTTTPRSRRLIRGFTLIELLTVIAIIGILAAILIPTVGAVRNKAKALRCTSQLRAWSQAIRLCANDNKGDIPLMIHLGDVTTSDLRFYTPYFNAKSVKSDSLVENKTLDPTTYFSICPAVDYGNVTDTEATRRYYNFVIPAGPDVKTYNANTRAFGRVLTADVPYYNLSRANSPSKLYLMMDTVPGGASDVVRGATYSSTIISRVRPLIFGDATNPIRHNGVVNVLFLDGSIRSQRWSDLEFKAATAAGDPRFTL